MLTSAFSTVNIADSHLDSELAITFSIPFITIHSVILHDLRQDNLFVLFSLGAGGGFHFVFPNLFSL